MANPSIQLGTNSNWAVKEDKLLAYKEYNDYFFNKEFDFSRGTSATYVAKDGLIKTAGIQPNIVTNGDFATDSDWTKGSGWSISGGKASNDGSVSGNDYLINSASTSIVGQTYKVVFTVSDYVQGNLRVRSGQASSTYINANGTYTQYQVSTSTETVRVQAINNFIGSIDNISVQEIQTDTPRIDFTNDTKGHLLLEPSRTNLVTQSQNTTIGYTHFNFSGGSLIDSYGYKSPDGTNNASRLVYTNSSAGSGGSLLTQNITINATGTYTISLWAKSISGIKQIRISPKNSGSQGTSGEVFTITNEWKKYSHTFTNDGATNRGFQFRILESDSSGDRTFDVWGMQLEEGDYATSTIPTTGATSTRNKDVCNNSGSAQDFNSEEGVLYAELASLAEDIGGSKNFSISDVGNNNNIKFTFRSTGSQIGVSVKSNGTNAVNIIYNMPISNFFKVAFKYKTNDCALWINGTEVATDTSAAMPLALNTLRFDRGDGGNDFLGKVRNVQVFTEALTDAELQELTS